MGYHKGNKNMMTLDEAIAHCQEKAEELRKQPFKEKMDIADCEECAEEHEQLAEWLKELKELRKENKNV